MQLNEKRPAEGALDSHYYRADELSHAGDLPDPMVTPQISIKLAKHHVISWKILREAWNKADEAKKDYICTGIYKVLNNTDKIPDSEETVRQNVCWSRSNLIIGPEGNIRLFDPGETLDFEAPSSIAPDARERVELLLALGALLMKYRDKGGTDSETWKLEFNATVKSLEARYMDICSFDRSAWKLFRKAKLVWGKSPTSEKAREVKETTQGLWYRGCVSADCVARLFPKGPDAVTTKQIGMDKIKGDRRTDLQNDLKTNQAAMLYKEKLRKDTLATNSQPAMVVATEALIQ